MATLTVNPTTITVTNIDQNNVTVNFTCDETLTDVKLSTDGGSTYKDKISMTQNSAVFDITGMSNNNYSCKLKGFYEEDESPVVVPVTSVSLNQSSHTFTSLDTLQLTATVLPSNATNKTVIWSSSNSNIITVNQSGLVTAIANGSATITVATQDGYKTATCNITVNVSGGGNVPVTGISLNKNTLALNVGETETLIATISPSNATNKNVNWYTSNSNIVTVSQSGLVTAIGSGITSVQVIAEDSGYTAYCNITVNIGDGGNVPVTGVSLDKNSHTFTSKDDTYQLTATVLPSDASNKNVAWTSSNNSIATVSNGLVTAKANGNCTITCTTVDGGKTATCNITVNIEESSGSYVILDPTSYSITDDILTVYFTSNKTIYGVKMNTTGDSVNFPYIATSFTQTSATFNLESVSDGSYDFRIQVSCEEEGEPSESVTSVSLDLNSKAINVGESFTLIPTVLPSSATNKDVNFTSSNLSVAGVSYGGTVTAYSEGTSTITCTTVDGGKTATCFVTVNSIGGDVAVTGISLNPNIKSIGVGESFTITPTIYPSNATNKTIIWSTNNYDVATVNNGVVTGISAGTCTITAATQDGYKTATCSITVTGGSSGGGSGGYVAKLSRLNIGTSTGYPTIPYRANFKPSGVYISINGGDFSTRATSASETEAIFDLTSLSLTNQTVHDFRLKFSLESGDIISEEGTIYMDIGGTGILPITSFNVTPTKSSIRMGETSKFVAEILPKGATPVGISYSSLNGEILRVDDNGEYLGLVTGNTAVQCVAMGNGQQIELSREITVTQGNQETPVSGNISVTFEDYKAVVSNGSVTRKYDVSYNKHNRWLDSKTITTSTGDECYLCLHENATSPFIIDGKRPMNGGWSNDHGVNIFTGYAGQVKSFSYGMKNESVPTELMNKCLYLINCSLPEANLYLDNNSVNTIKWEQMSDTYLGACWSYMGRFAIILNARTIGDSTTMRAASTGVHELGHTFGLGDQLTHEPTMYSYARDRDRCVYLQPNDIFCLKMAYPDILDGTNLMSNDEVDIKVDMDIESPLSCRFDFEYYETDEDMVNASDLVVECTYLNKEKDQFIIKDESTMLRYNVYNFNVTSVEKGEYINDVISVKVHESFELGLINDDKYKLYLCEYEDAPCSLINVEQGIVNINE